LTDKRHAMSPVAANREVDGLIRDGMPVEFEKAQGKKQQERVRVIDFNDRQANDFLAVAQLWVKGERGYRRPDILLYTNWLRVADEKEKVDRARIKRTGASVELAIAGLCVPDKLLDYVENFICNWSSSARCGCRALTRRRIRRSIWTSR
jgi:type I site-specific restriction-modification system R (restriction) subunit